MSEKTQKNPKKSSIERGVSQGKKLLLLDGNAIIHRSFHALPPLTTKKGELVNAVYGFSSTLLSVIEKFKPDYIIASFDLPGPTFRHEEYKEYKATRTKAPDELYDQIPKVKEVVRAFNIPIYEKKGFEADDVIGTIAKKTEKDIAGMETIIVTGDMDTLQLVSPKTKVYAMRRGISDAVTYDEDGVRDKYGLSPEQLKDFKGLRGDPSDNIPGVKGVGEKTASALLQEYGTLENVYKNLSTIKGSIKEKLERDKAQAFLSKDLGTIKTDVKFDLELEKAILHDFEREKIVSLFSELNFFSLIKRLPGKEGSSDIKSDKKGKEGVADFKYEKVSEKDTEKIIKELSQHKKLSLSIEEDNGKISGLSFSHKAGRAYFFSFSKKNHKILSSILSNDSIGKIGYDLKKSYKALKINGVELRNMHFDIMLASYILDPGKRTTMDSLILSELGEEIEIDEKKKGQLTMLGENEDEIIRKSCQKSDYTLKLKEVLEKEIEEKSEKQAKENNLKNVFEKIEMPLIKILADMELEGIRLNTLVMEGISEKITKRIQNLEKAIHKEARKEFNIKSTQQLRQVLFEDLGIPSHEIKKTKTGLSTASSELKKIKDEYTIIKKIEEYRELSKIKNTYLDALPSYADKNSRVHTTFNQAVTATGRLSSTDPNLQNIPIKTDLGKLLRTAFIAKDGYVFVSADYSQIDLRAIAHVSGDKKLIEAFQKGEDIHKITASEVNKVTPSQVTETMRRKAKELNFGIIYGMGAFGFSRSADIGRDEAQKFIDTYMEKFSGVAKYMKETREFAKKNGYVENILGRRRNITEINSPNFQVASAAERTAINMPIQGLASDIMKLSMIAAEKVVNKYGEDAKTLLQVHDELIFEVREDMAEKFSKEIKEAMENMIKLKVPLVIDIKTGDNWGEL